MHDHHDHHDHHDQHDTPTRSPEPAASGAAPVSATVRGNGVIVLTGATGFLGSHLLARLVERDQQRIVCLVRAKTPADAAARGTAAFEESNERPLTDDEASRVHWQRADLEEHRCGLSSSRWDALASEVTEVFHCAASTRFDLPLDEAQRINVVGVEHVHELAAEAARRHAFQRFHHVSTAYVSGVAKGRVDPDEIPSDRASNFRNTYERTKARAERFLRTQLDVPVTIYRPSIVAGDSRTGRTTNWNVLYAPMRSITSGRLPMLCRGGAGIVDAVAIDVVADAMMALADTATSRIESHHLTAGPTAFAMEDFVEGCNAAARRHSAAERVDTRLVGMARWHVMTTVATMPRHAPKRWGQIRRRGRVAARALNGFSPYQPYTAVNTIFDTSRTEPTLRAAGIEMPDGRTYLDTIIEYALATSFGRDTEGPAGTTPTATATTTAATNPGTTSDTAKVTVAA